MGGKSKRNKNSIWEMYTPNQLRIWPTGNTATNLQGQHFASVFTPHDKFNKVDGLRRAPTLPIDVLGRFGIVNMGFANHTNGYYHSRINKGFFDILIVLRGNLSYKINGVSKGKISVKNALVIPPDRLCDSYVECAKCNLLYIHLYDNLRTRRIFGGEIFSRALSYSDEISALVSMYQREIFGGNISLSLLNNIADTLSAYLKKEFFSDASTKIELADYVLKNELNSANAEAAAQFFGLKIRALEGMCQSEYGMSFAKASADIVMKESLKMLKSGSSNAAIARRFGYCDAYSFSRAFKNFFGQSPKSFLGK